MADINQISGLGTLNLSTGTRIAKAATGSGAAGGSADKAKELKAQFMGILLTQMQHQNPLDPMDTKEFTAQLAQFSSLEQQLSTNTKLDDLLKAIQVSSTASSFGYIGQTVELATPMSTLEGGKADWTYALSSDAASMKVKVMNKQGTVLHEKELKNVQKGTYSLDVSAADLGTSVKDGDILTLKLEPLSADGESIPTEIMTTVRIDGIETTSSGVSLRAGGLLFDAGDIRKIITTSQGGTKPV